MHPNLLDIVILLGAIQGFIISTLLYFKKENLYANKLLSVLIFLISLACLNLYLLNVEITKGSPFWSVFSLLFPLVIAMPIGPLVYFCVCSLQSNNFKLRREHRIHFYSVAVDLFPSLFGIVCITGALLNWIHKSSFSEWGNFIDHYNTYADVPRWISACFYTWFAWKKLIDFRQTESSTWPKQFVVSFVIFEAIWLVHLVPYLIPSISNELLDSVGWYPVYIPLVVMVYWLGFNGYLRAKPQSSKMMAEATMEEALLTLRKAMEQDKIFLNPELTLNELANYTGLTQKIISAVLNQQVRKNFNEFVNQYRLAAVKKKLLESGNEHLTITGIAFECGFNSQATFQRVFKQTTGVSPTQFLAQHSRKSA